MKKQAICVLLALLMVWPLAACRKKNKAPEPTPTAAPTASAAPASSAAPTPVQSSAPMPLPLPTLAPTPDPTPMPLSTPTPSGTPKDAPSASPAPTQTPAPGTQGRPPVITKQPKMESHFSGESAVFTAEADEWTSAQWTAVSPSGREIDMKAFHDTFPGCSIMGANETTLTITNLNIDMSGWSFYCTFENTGTKTKTDSARLKVTLASSGTSTGSGSGVGVSSKRLRCTSCGSDIPRDMLHCPYCGQEVYGLDERGYLEQDGDGSIYYIGPTGILVYDSEDRTSTYVDTNTNYAIFNDSGLVHYGNYDKEQQKQREKENLEAFMNGDPVPMLSDYLNSQDDN